MLPVGLSFKKQSEKPTKSFATAIPTPLDPYGSKKASSGPGLATPTPSSVTTSNSGSSSSANSMPALTPSTSVKKAPPFPTVIAVVSDG